MKTILNYDRMQLLKCHYYGVLLGTNGFTGLLAEKSYSASVNASGGGVYQAFGCFRYSPW
jgi:hypothetical protein